MSEHQHPTTNSKIPSGIEQNGSNGDGSYELDDLLKAPSSFDSNRRKERDRKGRQIVDTYLKTHHHSSRTMHETPTSAGAGVEVGNGGTGGGGNGGINPNSKTIKIKNAKKLDEYGFIVNIDDKGTIRNEDSFYVSGGASTPTLDYTHDSTPNVNLNTKVKMGKNMNINQMMKRRRNKKMNQSSPFLNYQSNHVNGEAAGGGGQYPSIQKAPSDPTSLKYHNQKHTSPRKKLSKRAKLQEKLIFRREAKWREMVDRYKEFSSKPKLKKLHARVRKGIPNSMRGKAWVTMAQVDTRIKAMNGVYADLVEQSCTDKLSGIHESLLPFVVRDEDGGDSNHDLDVQNQYDTENNNNGANDPTVDIMKETIERDINRTFPRHSMFYDSYSDSDDEEEDDDDRDEYYDSNASGHEYNDPSDRKVDKNGLIGGAGNGLYDEEMSDESYDQVSLTGSLGSTGQFSNEISHVIQDLGNLDTTMSPHQQAENDHCWTKSVRAIKNATANCPSIPYVDSNKGNAVVSMKSPPLPPPNNSTPLRKEKKKVDFATEEGGQAILRRVLRAYSLYDPEVGYCQGMNFIAGMFITFVTEEEAFWLLVYVMNAKPCRMRGLFGVGMSEAHQVLYVAEKLIAQFNPKLSKHFDRENIHVTMFATQWLLTMYTSSFPFHIVTRVWDCFILEGWKVAYRVMLALLEMATPDLLKLRFEDILNYFKVLPFQVDVNTLFMFTFNVPLKKKHIEKYAKEWLRKQQTDKITKQQRKHRKGK